MNDCFREGLYPFISSNGIRHGRSSSTETRLFLNVGMIKFTLNLYSWIWSSNKGIFDMNLYTSRSFILIFFILLMPLFFLYKVPFFCFLGCFIGASVSASLHPIDSQWLLFKILTSYLFCWVKTFVSLYLWLLVCLWHILTCVVEVSVDGFCSRVYRE